MIESIKDLLIDSMCKEISGDSIFLEEKNKDIDMKVKVNVGKLSGIGLRICSKKDTKKNGKTLFHPAMIAGKNGYRRSCDYLIIVPSTSAIDVYFIELKKTVSGNRSRKFEYACDQILNTVPVWDYIVSMVEKHFNEKKTKISQHFVIIANSTITSTKKRRTNRLMHCKHEGKNFTLAYSTKGVSLKDLKCPVPL